MYLHSTMYLLKLPAISKITSFYSVFTFHYVSIKTKTRLSVMSIQNYLHSTMYLLKPSLPVFLYLPQTNLHSTMYLLKHNNPTTIQCYSAKFTFHYVSIKTHLCSLQFLFQKDLHSTMYLLKLLSISV